MSHMNKETESQENAKGKEAPLSMDASASWDNSLSIGDTKHKKKSTAADPSWQPPGASQNSGGFPCWCCHAFKVKPWRKRHPLLFWGGILLVLFIMYSVGKDLVSGGFGQPKIAIAKIEGIIMDSGKINAWLDKLEKDDSVRGVVLRVDSPGGGVGASQEIFYAVRRLAVKKPVVVSMGSLAASGGYYISVPATRIFAVPSTITGSIGVKMSLANMEDLMKTIGVSSITLTTGDLKDAGSPFREMSEKEKIYLQGLIDDMFNDFVSVISIHRKLPKDAVLAVADGRGITGRQAVKDKLIDELGDLHDAVAWLKKECGFAAGERVVVIEGPEEEDKFIRRLLSSMIRETRAAETPLFMY